MIIELGLVFQSLKLANEMNVQGIQEIEIFGNSQGYFGHLIDRECTNFQVFNRGSQKKWK